jgi:hypothetical protein
VTLFNLGSAIVQPPTYVSTTGLGYAVTVGGALVRFNLDNPVAGAITVYTSRDVLAARALDNGDVVVAVAGGAVEVLAPAGAGLRVTAELETQGGATIVPSALEVVSTSAGLDEVLVSSAGSSTVFVYTSAALSSGSLAASPGPLSTLPPLFSVALVSLPIYTTNISGSSAGAAGAAAAGGAPGLSLGAVVTSVATSATNASNAADLVAVQGNTYATVALLGLASPASDEPAPARRPDLANRLPLGETTPLSRFVSGQADAVRQFRSAAIDEPPPADPWRDDLFQRPLSRTPVPEPPAPGQEEELEDEPGDLSDALATALVLFTFSARRPWDTHYPIPLAASAKRKQGSDNRRVPANE